MDTPNKKHLKESNQNGLSNIIEHFIESSYCSPFSFDVYTQNHEEYILEFNQKKRDGLDKLIIKYELEYYSWLKDVADYVFSGIDYNKPPTEEVRELLDIDAEILRNENPKKVYENCFHIVDFLEKQKTDTKKSDEDEKSEFSILEWATIFYYADETKLLTDDKTIKARIEKFMEKHKIKTSFEMFKNKYNNAKNRINIKSDYPISKLNTITPFVKDNYSLAVAKIENDKLFLENERDDY